MSDCSICYGVCDEKGATCESGHAFCGECFKDLNQSSRHTTKNHKCSSLSCESFLIFSTEAQKVDLKSIQTEEIEFQEHKKSMDALLKIQQGKTSSIAESLMETHYQSLFIEGTQETEKCPRCNIIFDVEYDGCNSLECPHCGCAFCALCLEDCGADAHDHITDVHGTKNIFNKPLYREKKNERRLKVISDALRKGVKPLIDLVDTFGKIVEKNPIDLLTLSLPVVNDKVTALEIRNTALIADIELFRDISISFEKEREEFRNLNKKYEESETVRGRLIKRISDLSNEINDVGNKATQTIRDRNIVEGWKLDSRVIEKTNVCKYGPYCLDEACFTSTLFHQKQCKYGNTVCRHFLGRGCAYYHHVPRIIMG